MIAKLRVLSWFVASALVSTSVVTMADIGGDTALAPGGTVVAMLDSAEEHGPVVVERPASISASLTAVTGVDIPNESEEIWVEISDAIESLNHVVGDKMFRDLRRRNESEMEVRVDVGFWQRVRYETRVDLKNDISNIWHLYVKQYYDGGFTSVHFVDDKTDKTIDIFTNASTR